MAQIDSQQYGELADYSIATRSGGGPFTKVFITGISRENQTAGLMQAAIDLENQQYLLNEKQQVFFIPLFLKKVARKLVSDGNRVQQEYFSWDPDNDPNMPEGTKQEYIFAGVLLDDQLKPAPDPDGEDHSALIYFQNNGIKMSSAIDFIDKIRQTGSGMNQLSDNEEFEYSVVTPRRFIIKTTVGTRSSNYGEKYVFEYELYKQLPDDLVVGSDQKEGIMQQSKKWVKPFRKQFDEGELSGKQQVPSSGPSQQGQVPFSEEENSEQNDSQNLVDSSDFDEIDLGI